MNHWVNPDSTAQVYLIVELQFTEPVELESIGVTKPSTGTVVRQNYNVPFSTGYIFFRRVDGAQFINGNWQIVLDVVADGTNGTYTGSIEVDSSVPTSPPSTQLPLLCLAPPAPKQRLPRAEELLRLDQAVFGPTARGSGN